MMWSGFEGQETDPWTMCSHRCKFRVSLLVMLARSPIVRKLTAALLAAVVLVLFPTSQNPRASVGVDMVLVISLDVSASVDAQEFGLMREGLARAISSRDVMDAVASGTHGAIAVSIVQWSGFQEQDVRIAWSRLSSQNQHLEFAGEIRNMRRRWHDGATDLGGAIDQAREMVLSAPFETTRRVIDIAGDGTNNVNQSPQIARDRAVAAGVIINALAVNDTPGGLVNYYLNFVIGGNGAFVETTLNYRGFEHAMRRKLVREIGTQLLF